MSPSKRNIPSRYSHLVYCSSSEWNIRSRFLQLLHQPNRTFSANICIFAHSPCRMIRADISIFAHFANGIFEVDIYILYTTHVANTFIFVYNPNGIFPQTFAPLVRTFSEGKCCLNNFSVTRCCGTNHALMQSSRRISSLDSSTVLSFSLLLPANFFFCTSAADSESLVYRLIL